MKQLLRQKLESQQGASIIMALFLFMVCAALAAVVLAAGTASAGRVAGLASADQKYYSVSSSAEVLRSMMGGEEGVSVNIVCEKTTPVNGGTTGSGEEVTCKIDGRDISEAGGETPSLTQQAAETLVEANTGSVWDWQLGKLAEDQTLPTLKLAHASAPSGIGEVAISEKLKPNGDIVMTISSGGGTSAYEMQLTCKALIETKTEATVVKAADGTMTRKDTKTTTITWKPAELKRSEGGS